MKRRESGGGVIVRQGRIVVVRQRHDVYSLPKGHVEEGETLLEACLREIREETGLADVRHVRELGTYERFRIGLHEAEDESELKVITVHLFETEEEALAPEDPKILEARWVAPGEAVELLTHPRDAAFLADHLPL